VGGVGGGDGMGGLGGNGGTASTSVVDGFLKFSALAGGAMIGDYDELMNSDLNKITRACLLVAHTFIYTCGQDNSTFGFF